MPKARRKALICALVLAVVGCAGAPAGRTAFAVHPTAARAAAGPAFTFSAARLGPTTRRRVRGSSWHPGCPVALADLRLLRIGYWGFDGRAHVGRMIVAATSVEAMRRAVGERFRGHFPIPRMGLRRR